MPYRSNKHNMLNCALITLSAQQAYCDAIDRLVEQDRRGSRSLLLEVALEHYAATKGVRLPPRLATSDEARAALAAKQ
jgi:hypothetical protein